MKDSIIKFADEARKAGLNVGMQECFDALTVANTTLIESQSTFKSGLRAIFCTSEDDYQIFNQLFDDFWIEKVFAQALGQKTVRINKQKKNPTGTVVMMGKGTSKEEVHEGKSVTGANAMERLRRTDFSHLKEMDSEFLNKIADALFKQMSVKLKRRMKSSTKRERIDLRRTIRKNIGHGGDPIERVFKAKKRRKPRLIVLLDISGSMDKYSFFLLRFIYALQENFETLESFTFSTRLRRITDLLKKKGLDKTLQLLSNVSEEWSSGTKIGQCLSEFNTTYAKRVLSGQSITIILSDGLETGNVNQMELELQKIKLRTGKLIWLNPLKGMKNYQPTARGMESALPHIDTFRSAHSIDSLLQLENYLAHV